jgi:manganese/zinc/iron transport system permease protein
VLYGAIELVALDTRPVLGLEVPRAVIVLASVFLIDGLVVLLLYKEFKLSSFDPALATTLGINANLMHYVLMCLVAATTVASFESVGSILVIAMLIVPASTAFLLTHRFGPMILLSLVVGAVSAVLGHVSAITVPTWFGFRDTTTAGSMAVVAGLLFLVAFLVAPRRGLVSRIADRFRLALRIVEEDVLGVLYRLEEKRGAGQGALGGRFLREVLRSGPVVTTAAVLSLKRRGRIFAGPDGYQLSATGRAAAARVVRSHRLWESYLDEVLAQPADHVHTAADRMEHYIPWSLQREISNELADAARDPHGQPIPRRDEDDSAPAGGP